MTPKTSRIEDILNINRKENAYGVTFYYDLVLENGDRGSVGKKSDDAFRVGQQFTYTAEEGPFGLRFKEFREQFGNGNGGGWQPKAQGAPQAVQVQPRQADDRNRSFALAYAKDVVVALVSANGGAINSEQAASATLRVADRFLEWLSDGK